MAAVPSDSRSPSGMPTRCASREGALMERTDAASSRHTRVIAAAAELGLEVEVRAFPAGTRTAEDAAAAIGCGVAQIVKSLVFLVDEEPVIALISGADRLDE